MNGPSRIFFDFRHNLAVNHRFWWLILTLGLGGIYFLARAVEPDNIALFQQLAVLYAVDSLLFFFTDRASAKMGVLTLIFLTTMEVIVTIFYLISVFGGIPF